MGMKTRAEYAEESAQQVVDAAATRWQGTSLVAEVRNHKSGMARPYVFIDCPRLHWRAVAKWLRFEMGVDHCSMITGIHWAEGPAEKKWEVVAHLMRMNVINPPVKSGWTEQVIRDPSILQDNDVPMEFEISISIPDTTTPSVQSVQEVWMGADWNEKETWDLVGIDFEGHEGMRRVLQPHDTPVGFHPLQKQHMIRYHDYEIMYDDPQGFGRKPVDEGKVK
ncbi:MAG: NADH-quinone oxidoreductase subunit C [Euryarchaeota archaeon]|jgi:NADH:ubiquinone oxidoreductase subunit C|nr:NADH-quinone oxidoreductase subunit C [Euryarchaeota archaeon]